MEAELAFAQEYLHGEHHLPEPLHLSTLVLRLMLEKAEARLRSANWAADQVEAWPDAASRNPEATLNILRSTLQTAEQEDG